MLELKARAPAKINLALDVLGKRPDGYHELRMLMQSVSLYDELTLSLLPEGGAAAASSNRPDLPRDDRNLALRAARLFLGRTGRGEWGCSVHINKKIPVSAGLGGGSSDAAAVLRALNAHFENPIPQNTLMGWALELGSDVPFCLRGGLCLAEGRGERLTPLPPLPDCRFVLCTPPISISTAAMYERIDSHPPKHRPDWPGLESAMAGGDLAAFARLLYNVFEPLQIKQGAISEIRRVILGSGAPGAVMSGSGPTVVGIFADDEKAEAARAALAAAYADTFVCKGV